MKKIILLLVCLTLLSSCSLFHKNKNSICQTIKEPSYICKIANKNKVDIEEVGKIIKIANTLLIIENKYTAKQAIEVLKDVKSVLNSSISYIEIYSRISNIKFKYPELFIIMDCYFDEFQTTLVLTDFDKKLLNNYIDQLITEMEFLISVE